MKSEKLNEILIYTRIPNDDYTESLANSVHFAYKNDENEFVPLNRNYGIIFAVASIDDNNVIQERGLKNPYIFRTEEGLFGITATAVDKFGNDDVENADKVLYWTSQDLINFKSHGFIDKCENSSATETVVTNIEDSIPGNSIAVEKTVFDKVLEHWLPVYNTEIKVPENVVVSSEEELRKTQVKAIYSDHSIHEKRVKWDLSNIDFSVPGSYTVSGKVIQEILPFPLAKGYADPVIFPWDGKYYFLSTNDNKNDIGMYVREGNTKEELFAPGFKEAVILDVDEERNFIQTFWAPEFHVIGDSLYILFAVGGKEWAPQCHMMKLKKGGNIMNMSDWGIPQRVRKADGTFLTEDGITLDMTYFKADGVSCVAWSYRKHIGTPLDTGSMIYIAEVDENNPSILTSEPVLLTRPLYGWENLQGTINNEGPYPLITEDTVYLAYSGGAAGGYTYAVGLLSIPRGGNYLDAKAWNKAMTPALSYYSIDSIYGPGHNSFFCDYDGNIYIMYHVEEEIVRNGRRCSTMHRVHFNKENKPIFNMGNERDLNQELANVKMHVTIKQHSGGKK